MYHVKSRHRSKRLTRWTAVCLLLLILSGGAWATHQPANVVPEYVRKQLPFKPVYPARSVTVNPASFQFDTRSKTLAFDTTVGENRIFFTEQTAPGSIGAGNQVYYPALGIHPYAQFTTDLGPVALTRFWQAGNLQPLGQSAVLATKGTFVVAHAEKNLTNAQWKSLFDTLTVK